MTDKERERLEGFAVLALLAISLVAIIGGIWAATAIGREIEGIVAVVTGAVGGIVAIVIRDTTR